VSLNAELPAFKIVSLNVVGELVLSKTSCPLIATVESRVSVIAYTIEDVCPPDKINPFEYLKSELPVGVPIVSLAKNIGPSTEWPRSDQCSIIV